MAITSWLVGHSELIATVGVIAALLFTGNQQRVDTRVRRAETRLEITAQHRDLWTYLRGDSRYAGMFDKSRNLQTNPVSDDEVFGVNLVLLHLRASLAARSAGIFTEPECLKEDMREFLTYPVRAAAWEQLKRYQDAKFVRFVEGKRETRRGQRPSPATDTTARQVL